MDISRVALDGLHRAEVKLEKAATRIASYGADSSGGPNTDTVDLSAEMVAIMSAKTEFSANLKSLEAAGEEEKQEIQRKVVRRQPYDAVLIPEDQQYPREQNADFRRERQAPRRQFAACDRQ